MGVNVETETISAKMFSAVMLKFKKICVKTRKLSYMKLKDAN